VRDAMFHADGTFSCSIFVEVRPDIQLAGYVGLELAKPPIDEEAIAVQLVDGLRDRYSRMEDRDQAEPGAMATVDYRVAVGDKVLADMESQAFMIMPDGGSPLGSILSGMAVGEVREDKITLSPDFGEHAGQEADIRVALKSARVPVRLSDDELVEAARKDDGTIQGFEDLMERARKHAGQEAARRVRQSLEAQVVDRLLDLHDFEVPQQWVEDETLYLLSQLKVAKPDGQIMKAVREMALKNVRRTFIMDAIYDAEQQLAVAPEELKKFLESEAARLGIPEITLRKKIIKQNMMDSVVGSIKNRKIMDFLIANAVLAEERPEGGQAIEILPPQEAVEEEVIEILPPQD
jgi:trigger factor